MMQNKRAAGFMIACLLLVSLFSFSISAEDGSDIDGHWAESELRYAVERGWLNGYEDGNMHPDDPVTGAQAAAILTRILRAQRGEAQSDAWYALAVAQAGELGLMDGVDELGAPLTRRQAFVMLAEAFCLYHANENTDTLRAFRDAGELSRDDARLTAGIVNAGIVKGTGDSLNLNGSLTRAEFAVMLSRIMENSAVAENGGVTNWEGNRLWIPCDATYVALEDVKAEMVIVRSQELNSISFERCEIGSLVYAADGKVTLKESFRSVTVAAGTGLVTIKNCAGIGVTGDGRQVIVDCDAQNLNISGDSAAVTAKKSVQSAKLLGDHETLVLKSGADALEVRGVDDRVTSQGKLKTLLVSGSYSGMVLSDVDKMSVTGQNSRITVEGNAAEIRESGDSNIITVKGNVDSAEWSGRASQLTVSGDVGLVKTTGNNAKVTVDGDAGTVSSSGSASSLTLQNASLVEASGQKSVIDISGKADELRITGDHSTVNITGSVEKTYLRAKPVTLVGDTGTVTDDVDYGLRDAVITIDHPEVLEVGQELVLKASISGVKPGMVCEIHWNVDSEPQKRETVTLKGDDVFTYTKTYTYTRDMPLSEGFGFYLEYTTAHGEKQSISKTFFQKLKNHPADYYDPWPTLAEVKAKVDSVYDGDYTQAWAEGHDLTEKEKIVFVSGIGYSSDTQYLLWINKDYQRVNIFQGQKGAWKLIRTCLVGTGAPGRGTPSGVFKTTYKQDGWYTSTYTCKPIVRFYGGGYAFHSRLHTPDMTGYTDASIGFPVSHGCVRMYDEDIQWIYDNIPDGTTVISY